MSGANFNNVWSVLLIEELIRNGINHFCISPGSRSTPLTVAVARHPRAKTIICHDERGAAFYALGYARSAGKCAVLICTSGTAAAHYYPAVIEASIDRLPMLIFSADRPPELQQTGANQTIQQGRLFGPYAKWYLEIPCPDAAIPGKMLLTTIDQAVYQAHSSPPGPVHLNAMFREPLEPSPGDVPSHYLEGLWKWTETTDSFTNYGASVKLPAPAAIEKVTGILQSAGNGMVSVGRLNTASERQAVINLLKILNWPTFADIASGLRLGIEDIPVVHYFDQLLLAKTFRDQYRPDTILHIGGELTSKRFLQFVEDTRPQNHLVIKDHSFRHDPLHNISYRLDVDIERCCLALIEHLGGCLHSEGLNRLFSISTLVDEVIAGSIVPGRALTEISVARLVSENIPASHGLWLASSMPIRDMDMYGSGKSPAVRVGCNRGASGIDGTIASAMGFAEGLESSVTLIIGDLAFLHDINSLALLKKSCTQSLIIIIINNNGGGIFSFLPVADIKDIFEEYFAAPHNIDFEFAAKLFSIAHFCPRTNAEFIEIYRNSVSAARSVIIEVSTDRAENYQLHQTLQKRIIEQIESYL